MDGQSLRCIAYAIITLLTPVFLNETDGILARQRG
jgi:hypothetical protein